MSGDDETRTPYQSLGAPGEHSQISGSVPEELAHALLTKEVCGECGYFELAEGRRLMAAQQFMERLVREEGWQAKYLASPVNDIGLCGAHSSGRAGAEEVITGRMHKACDQFRRDKGVVSIRRKTTDPR